jgi:starch synthase
VNSKDCAIFYDENAFSIKTDKLMGRNSAGVSFLKGYFSHGTPKRFWVYAQTTRDAQVFADTLFRYGSKSDAQYINWNNFSKIKSPGNIFYPGPDFNKLAWQRRFVGETAWSICGITHTTSSAAVMDAIGDYYAAPVKSWDALICTSSAVKENVEFILERKKRYLQDEFDFKSFEHPKLPTIPLGINTKEFEFSKDDRVNARSFFNIGNDTIVVVYVGRLSFHAKANPTPMYLAVEKAAQLNPTKKIMIIECGWHSNDWIKKSFTELSNSLLNIVELIHVDGRDQDNVKMVWCSADMFCSFSDNIQETFGISPIEAMASGLPVVVSDWDGYKESVRDEVDGFRIRTLMPEGGFGSDLAVSHAIEIDNYDNYIGKTSAFISVDIEQASNRFDQLFKSKNLRKKLGENAKRQAVQKYDWKHIIPQYEDLWASLSEERAKHSLQIKARLAWPERSDPFLSFGHYSTRKLNEADTFEFCYQDLDKTVEMFHSYRVFQMSTYLDSVLPSDDEFLKVFKLLETGGLKSQDLLINFVEIRRPLIYRSLFWLLKMGLLKVSNSLE